MNQCQCEFGASNGRKLHCFCFHNNFYTLVLLRFIVPFKVYKAVSVAMSASNFNQSPKTKTTFKGRVPKELTHIL